MAEKKMSVAKINCIVILAVLALAAIFATGRVMAERKIVNDRDYYHGLSQAKDELLQIERLMRSANQHWSSGEKLEARTEFWKAYDMVKNTRRTSSLGIIPAQMAADSAILTKEERTLVTIEKSGEVIVNKDYNRF